MRLFTTKKTSFRMLRFWLLLAGILSACAGKPSSQSTITQASPQPSSGASTTGISAPTPTVRKELHATDPSTVSLVSGQPQLVEFFAFW
jgi:hypothetical protein